MKPINVCLKLFLIALIISNKLYCGFYCTGYIESWDTDSLKEQKNQTYCCLPPNDYTISPDDSLIAIASSYNASYERSKISIYKYSGRVITKDSKPITEFDTEPLDDITFCDDNEKIAISIQDKIIIYNWNTGVRDTIRLPSQSRGVFPFNNKILVVYCRDNYIRTFSTLDYKLLNELKDISYTINFSRDLNTMYKTDSMSFKSIKYPENTINWENSLYPSIFYGYSISPDSRFIAGTANQDYSSLAILTYPGLKKYFEFRNYNPPFKFSPDGKYLTYLKNGLKFFNLKDSTISESKEISDLIYVKNYDICSGFNYSISGKYLYFQYSDTVAFWNIKDKAIERKIYIPKITNCILSPDDNYFIFSTQTMANVFNIKVYSIKDSVIISDIKTAQDISSHYFHSFTEDGKYVYLFRQNRNILKIDLMKGIIIDSIPKQFRFMTQFIESKYIFGITDSSKIGIYDIRNKKIVEFSDYPLSCSSAMLSPDGKSMISSFDDYSIFVYSFPDSLTENFKLKILSRKYGHPGSIRISFDSKYVATFSRYCKLWNAQTGELIYAFNDFLFSLANGGFSADSKKLYEVILVEPNGNPELGVGVIDTETGRKNIHIMKNFFQLYDYDSFYFFSPMGKYFINRELRCGGSSDVDEGSKNNNSEDCIIYPNPASDYININTNQLVEQVSSIEIYNVLGERVQYTYPGPILLDGEVKIGISGLPPGMYYIALRTKKDVHYERFVVAR